MLRGWGCRVLEDSLGACGRVQRVRRTRNSGFRANVRKAKTLRVRLQVSRIIMNPGCKDEGPGTWDAPKALHRCGGAQRRRTGLGFRV